MPEPTMHCHLCPTVMPAQVVADHMARRHPDPDNQVDWWDGSPRPILVDLVPEPSDFGGGVVSMPEPVNCYRCGQPGYTRWIDTKTLRDPGPVWVAGEQYCETDGCTDLDGSRRLVALTPAQLRDKADAAWMARQRALAEPPTEPSRWARWFMGEWLATGVLPWKERK